MQQHIQCASALEAATVCKSPISGYLEQFQLIASPPSPAAITSPLSYESFLHHHSGADDAEEQKKAISLSSPSPQQELLAQGSNAVQRNASRMRKQKRKQQLNDLFSVSLESTFAQPPDSKKLAAAMSAPNQVELFLQAMVRYANSEESLSFEQLYERMNSSANTQQGDTVKSHSHHEEEEEGEDDDNEEEEEMEQLQTPAAKRQRTAYAPSSVPPSKPQAPSFSESVNSLKKMLQHHQDEQRCLKTMLQKLEGMQQSLHGASANNNTPAVALLEEDDTKMECMLS